MATIEGLSDGGVLPVVKHFPGHGSADSDSHLGRSIGPPLAELRENDLVPFIEAIAFRKAAIMVGHIVVPGLTDDLPASLSKAAIDGLLRSDLNFDGLVVTDSLNMRSISDHWTVDEAAVMSLAAGADLLVLGNLADVGPAFDAIDRAVHEGLIPVDRVDDAANRVLRAKNINACTLVGRVRGVLNTVYDW
jgi:beta-N-acetylhexosaminidase